MTATIQRPLNCFSKMIPTNLTNEVFSKSFVKKLGEVDNFLIKRDFNDLTNYLNNDVIGIAVRIFHHVEAKNPSTFQELSPKELEVADKSLKCLGGFSSEVDFLSKFGNLIIEKYKEFAKNNSENSVVVAIGYTHGAISISDKELAKLIFLRLAAVHSYILKSSTESFFEEKIKKTYSISSFFSPKTQTVAVHTTGASPENANLGNRESYSQKYDYQFHTFLEEIKVLLEPAKNNTNNKFSVGDTEFGITYEGLGDNLEGSQNIGTQESTRISDPTPKKDYSHDQQIIIKIIHDIQRRVAHAHKNNHLFGKDKKIDPKIKKYINDFYLFELNKLSSNDLKEKIKIKKHTDLFSIDDSSSYFFEKIFLYSIPQGFALMEKRTSSIKKILNELGLQAKDTDQQTQKLFEANTYEEAENAISGGAYIHAIDSLTGHTPLTRVLNRICDMKKLQTHQVISSNPECVKDLEERISEFKKIIQLLIENGANVNQCIQRGEFAGYTALHLAAQYDDVDLIRMLNPHSEAPTNLGGGETKPKNVFTKNYSGATALSIAASCGNLNVVEALLQYLTDEEEKLELINSRDNNGNTALHLAANLGFTKVVEFLLSNGAHNSIQNNYGKSAKDIIEPNNTDQNLNDLELQEIKNNTPLVAINKAIYSNDLTELKTKIIKCQDLSFDSKKGILKHAVKLNCNPLIIKELILLVQNDSEFKKHTKNPFEDAIDIILSGRTNNLVLLKLLRSPQKEWFKKNAEAPLFQVTKFPDKNKKEGSFNSLPNNNPWRETDEEMERPLLEEVYENDEGEASFNPRNQENNSLWDKIMDDYNPQETKEIDKQLAERLQKLREDNSSASVEGNNTPLPVQTIQLGAPPHNRKTKIKELTDLVIAKNGVKNKFKNIAFRIKEVKGKLVKLGENNNSAEKRKLLKTLLNLKKEKSEIWNKYLLLCEELDNKNGKNLSIR